MRARTQDTSRILPETPIDLLPRDLILEVPDDNVFNVSACIHACVCVHDVCACVYMRDVCAYVCMRDVCACVYMRDVCPCVCMLAVCQCVLCVHALCVCMCTCTCVMCVPGLRA